MQLSKTAYYADFAIYAIVLLVLISIVGLSADWAERLKWVAALTTGGATWTFLEYLLHRFVLHPERSLVLRLGLPSQSYGWLSSYPHGGASHLMWRAD